MDIINQRCPGCDATLKYNPETKNFKCEYCMSEYELEQLEEIYKKGNSIYQSDGEINQNEGFESCYQEQEYDNNAGDMGQTANQERIIYTCPSCGAELVTDSVTVATSCVYCKSTNIIRGRLKDTYLPDEVIPFEKTKNDAIDGFKKSIKGKIFAPKEFFDPKNINSITGVYVPFWLFDILVSIDWDGEGKKIKTWRAGNMQYTKTDVYSLKRVGFVEFEKVPADSSTKFADNLMDSIEPYTYSKLKPFNDAYLSGFLAEKYDVSEEDSRQRVYDRMMKTCEDEMRTSCQDYDFVSKVDSNMKAGHRKTTNVMLPVWMLNIKYNDKIYHFAMNGETGKMIGEVPILWEKVIGYSLFIFFGVFITLFALSWILNVPV